MKAKCCLWLHEYGRQKDGVGTCPVKLRVTFNVPKTHQYSISGPFLQNQLKSQYQELFPYLTKAEKL